VAVAPSAELEVHAAALYTALLRAKQLERAREFQDWWTSEKKIARGSTRTNDQTARRIGTPPHRCVECGLSSCECWDDDFEGPDDYDADELGLDPEDDYDA